MEKHNFDIIYKTPSRVIPEESVKIVNFVPMSLPIEDY